MWDLLCETLAPCSVYGADVAAPSVGGIEGTVLALCGHHFCNDCWRQYLRIRSRAGNNKHHMPSK